ncbi:hypothetical protein [Pseudooceanicola sp. 200-1SW]|uniref:hypothetical protein n=1 Tax=Pseudooceanicola sp. 200-1SW TaxID=3425949 RepID=UPI003D7F9294
MMRAERIFRIVEATGIFVGILALALGAAEYRRNSARDRQEASLQYILQFQTDPVRQSYNRVSSSWFDYDLAQIFALPNREEVTAALSDRIVHAEGGKEFISSFTNLVGFLDAAAACAKASVCDSLLLSQEFAGPSHTLMCLHGSLIETIQRQQDRLAFGAGLRFFAATSDCRSTAP